MPISGRLVVQYTSLLLAIGFAALLGVVAATIWLNERAQSYATDAIEARAMRIAAVELRSAMQSAESSQRGFLVSGNEIYLAPFDSAKAATLRQMDRLKQLYVAYPDSEALLARLSVVIGDKVVEMDQTIRQRSEGKEAEALALFRSNRGKALSDEANVYLSSLIRSTDERLTTGMAEQNANAAWLRWMTILGGLVIIAVVGSVTAIGARYAQEIAQARDEIRNLNVSLEKRVEERTAALGRARDRAEVLLAEVNHRVANGLMMVASLVRMQARAVTNPEAKQALAETEARIQAISDVHKQLYTSGDAHLVALDEYLSGLLRQLQSSMQSEGHGASLDVHLEPLKLPVDTSINLGMVVTEWVTNAFKYAYPDRRGAVRIRLARLPDGRGELRVEDDGIGRGEAAPKGTGLGSRLVTAMANNVGGTIEYLRRERGTTAQLTFPVPAQ